VLQLAILQFKPRKGAYAENLARLGDGFGALASGPAPDLVVLPEAALTGYFLEGGVRELARTAEQLYEDLTRIHTESGAPPFDIVIGFYELWQTRLHNSALVASLGGPDPGIRHVHRKIFLPTYGVFDEERFVEPGDSVAAFDTRWGRAAVIICEDAWHSLVPTIAALDGAQLILVVSASPARGLAPDQDGDGRPTSLIRWERTVQGIAAEHGVYVVLAQLVGFEGGKGFPGGSLVLGPGGEVLARGALFEEQILRVALDFDEIPRVRAEYPLLSDLQSRLPHLLDDLALGGSAAGRLGSAVRRVPGPPVRGAPGRPAAVPPNRLAAEPLAIDPDLTHRWLVEFLRDEIIRRRGFARGVVALSGGVDSAVVAFLAAEALGPGNLTALRLPYRLSSPDSLEHAQRVIDQLGIRGETIAITGGVDGLVGQLPAPPDAARLGNLCARMRMIALFDRAAGLGALPIGTGNKSERLLGYFTWHADDTPPVNPLGDLFKTQVLALARHLGVPEEIVRKPPTADLVAGQTDEGDFGISYARADLILHGLLQGYAPERIEALGFARPEVELVRKRLDSTHWKRRLPTVAVLSGTAINEFYLRPVDY
jgi:NAD+ synthase (glutamine-hydrolysing)